MKTHTGTIQITEELTLNNPTMDIITVQYNWVDNIASVEIHFKEPDSALTHSRMFEFELDKNKEYTTLDIIEMVSNHSVLGLFE